MSDYLAVLLLALAIGAAGALCIFSAYDMGLHRGRHQGIEQERRRRWFSPEDRP